MANAHHQMWKSDYNVSIARTSGILSESRRSAPRHDTAGRSGRLRAINFDPLACPRRNLELHNGIWVVLGKREGFCCAAKRVGREMQISRIACPLDFCALFVVFLHQCTTALRSPGRPLAWLTRSRYDSTVECSFLGYPFHLSGR